MNVYVACGLTHVPREIFGQYVGFIHNLAAALRGQQGVASVKYALVNSDPQLAERPKSERPALCYVWDRMMVEEANLIVADASFPSTGMGIELQIAESSGKPIVMLIGDYGVNRVKPVHYENPDHTGHDLQVGEGIVSLMALGLPTIKRAIPYVVNDPATADVAHAAAIAKCLNAVALFIPG
jgi:hypothetical protein